MIAKLTKAGLEAFESYFKTMRASNSELFSKIMPRSYGQGKQKAIYVVKTFCTDWAKDEDGYPVEVPISKESLVDAYELVKASPAVDIWSFGVVLYTLCVGKPLFAVNRDDDLDGGRAMHELFKWDDSIMTATLRDVVDPAARDLLSQLLRRDPKQRLRTMADVLEHPFFTLDTDASSEELKQKMANILKGVERSNRMLDEQKAAINRIAEATEKIHANTIELKILNIRLMDKFDMSTAVILKAAFEANEVSMPACFIILPYELVDPKNVKEEESMLKQAVTYFDAITGAMDAIENPKQYATNFFSSKLKGFKKKFTKKHYFVYLVDEYTGNPVKDDKGPYPIRIDVNSDLVERFLPMMKIGLTTMSIINGVASIVSMFYPVVPGKIFPDSLKKKAKAFVASIESGGTDFESIQNHIDAGNEGGEAKRGSELRDFENFLQEHDPERLYAGLCRVCDVRSGNAMWVTEESKSNIEKRNAEGTTSGQINGSSVVTSLQPLSPVIASEATKSPPPDESGLQSRISPVFVDGLLDQKINEKLDEQLNEMIALNNQEMKKTMNLMIAQNDQKMDEKLNQMMSLLSKIVDK
jgi:hypothetical protein